MAEASAPEKAGHVITQPPNHNQWHSVLLRTPKRNRQIEEFRTEPIAFREVFVAANPIADAQSRRNLQDWPTVWHWTAEPDTSTIRSLARPGGSRHLRRMHDAHSRNFVG